MNDSLQQRTLATASTRVVDKHRLSPLDSDMTTYRDAVRRLQIIYNECAPKAKERRDADRNVDDFTRLKRQIHIDALKDREELLGTKPGSKEAAELSHKIRSKLKTLREDAMKLQALNKKEEKKKKTTEDQEKYKNHEELVQLVFKHIEECETLEKKRFNDKIASDRSALFAGAAPIKIDVTNFPNGRPGASVPGEELPDIDNDPELARELVMLQQGNRDIDTDLEQIQTNVTQLKEIAINMDRELAKQNNMLEEIDKKVDKAQIHMDNVNIKMKQAVDGVMKGDKFIVNCVLICVLLGLASFITSYFV